MYERAHRSVLWQAILSAQQAMHATTTPAQPPLQPLMLNLQHGKAPPPMPSPPPPEDAGVLVHQPADAGFLELLVETEPRGTAPSRLFHSPPPPWPPMPSPPPPVPHPPPPPPSPSPGPPPPPPVPVVDRLNRRYNDFVRGSSQLDELGLILHSVDGFEDGDKPWAACLTHDGFGGQCDVLGDRISASIIFKGKPTSFASNNFGGYRHGGSYVLNPKATRVLCAFGGDGATRGKSCHPPGLSETCIPACIPQVSRGNSVHDYDSWCSLSGSFLHGPADYWCDGHPWKPEDVGEMLERDRKATAQSSGRQQDRIYNEVVVDGHFHNAHLPLSIEAFVASPGDQMDVVRTMQRNFVREHGLTDADVPLLVYHPDRDTSGRVFEVDRG